VNAVDKGKTGECEGRTQIIRWTKKDRKDRRVHSECCGQTKTRQDTENADKTKAQIMLWTKTDNRNNRMHRVNRNNRTHRVHTSSFTLGFQQLSLQIPRRQRPQRRCFLDHRLRLCTHTGCLSIFCWVEGDPQKDEDGGHHLPHGLSLCVGEATELGSFVGTTVAGVSETIRMRGERRGREEGEEEEEEEERKQEKQGETENRNNNRK